MSGAAPGHGRRGAVERDRITRFYDDLAPRFGEGAPYFSRAGQRLVEHACLRPGEHVLDIGCGRGASLIPASRAVGAEGSVRGIDLSPEMVSQTRSALASLRMSNTTVEVMDASDLFVPDASFDVILGGFSLFFLNDVPQFLNTAKACLRPGGRMWFANTRTPDPAWEWWNELIGRYPAVRGLAPINGTPGIREAGVLTGMLAKAGMTAVAEYTEIETWHFPSPDAWWNSLWNYSTRRSLDALTRDEHRTIRREVAPYLESMMTPSGIPEIIMFVYTTASRPGP